MSGAAPQTRKPPSPTRARPGGWSPNTRADMRTRSTGTISTLRRAVADPDKAPIRWTKMRAGMTLGWLTLEADPVSQDGPICVRCVCGARTTPLARHVAEGKVRACGDLTRHGVYA